MPINSRYTTLDVVFNRLQIQSNSSIDEQDAIEWVTEILGSIAPQEILQLKFTDGNRDEGHPNPIAIVNYRGEMPCDAVHVLNVIDLESFAQLRENFSASMRINMKNTPGFEKWNGYTPDVWTKGNASIGLADGTYQIKGNHIYVDFETGGIIAVYLGWPMDEEENLLIPSDPKIIRAVTSFLQYKIDYKLWRNGDITDKIFEHSERAYLFDVGSAQTSAKMPSEGMMQSILQFMTSWVPSNNAFRQQFASTGRSDKFRTQ